MAKPQRPSLWPLNSLEDDVNFLKGQTLSEKLDKSKNNQIKNPKRHSKDISIVSYHCEKK